MKKKIIYSLILIFALLVISTTTYLTVSGLEGNNVVVEPSEENIIFKTFDNVDFTYDKESRQLTIDGNGLINSTLISKIDDNFEAIGGIKVTQLIEKIVVGNKITEISEKSLLQIYNLKEIEILGTTLVRAGAFYNCSNLESLTIPFVGGSFSSKFPLGYLFGTESFSLSVATEQTYYDLLDQLTTTTFYIPEKLKEVNISSGNIYCGAFENCKNIAVIKLPDTINPNGKVVYGEDAFKGCNSLSNVAFSNFDLEDDKTWLDRWLNIEFTNAMSNPMYYASRFALKNSDGTYTEVYSIDFTKQTDIGDYQFYGFENLVKVNFEVDNISIGKYAFYGCSSLVVDTWIDEDIIFVKGKYVIGENAFYGCDQLDILYIDEESKPAEGGIGKPYFEVNAYGVCGEKAKYVFSANDKMLRIYGAGDLEIKENIYLGVDLSYIYTLIIGDNIKSIPMDAFSGFINLKQVTIGTSVIEIGENAFKDSQSLLSFHFLGNFSSNFNNKFLPIPKEGNSVNLVITHSSSSKGWDNIKSYVPDSEDEVWSAVSVSGAYEVCLPEEKTILTEIGNYYIDAQGIKYELEDTTAKVSGYVCRNSNITAISIPSKVYFYNGSKTISYDVVEIKENAFSTIDCDTLTAISILASDIKIGVGALSHCSNLDVIYFESGFASVSSSAEIKSWRGNLNNDKLYFVSLTELSDEIKNYCNGAQIEIYYANTLTDFVDEQGIIYTLDSQSMQAMVGQKTDVLDTGINTSNSSNVEVVIPNFVSYNGRIYMVVGFDRYAFYKSPTTKVTFGKFIGFYENKENPAIWDNTFREMDNLEFIEVINNDRYVSDSNGLLYGKGLDFTILNNVTGEEIVRNPLRLIKAPSTIENATLLNNTTVIERYAFSGNVNLKSVNLSGVQVIGSNAFNNCVSLENAQNSNSIYYIESYGFANTKISQFKFDAIIFVGDGAFLNSNLTGEIQLANGLVYVGEGAFRYNNVSKFAIEQSNPKYYTDSVGVLYEKVGEKYIVLQYPTASNNTRYLMHESNLNITEIKPYAFSGAKNLIKVSLSDDTEIVGSYAFENCSGLKEIYLGKNYYGSSKENAESGLYSYGLFDNAFSLSKIIVSDYNEHFANDENGVLYSKDYQTLYCYPAGIERSSYTLNKNTQKIYSGAFYYNHHLRRVIVSNPEFSKIGDMAFASCDSLEEIYFGSECPLEVGEKIFENTNLAVRYKEGFDSWKVYDGKKWNGANVSSYKMISQLSNSSVDTKEYLFVVLGTDGNPIEDCRVSIYIGNNKTPITQQTDYEGLAFFSRVNFEQVDNVDGKEIVTIPTITIELFKEDYFTYKQEIHLDFNTNISYITLSKLPEIYGVSCDDNDINSTHYTLNISEYGQKEVVNTDYVQNKMAEDISSGKLSNDEIMKNSKMTVDETIVVKALMYYDAKLPDMIMLHQNGVKVKYSEDDFNLTNSVSTKTLTTTFVINPKDLIPDVPLEVAVCDLSGEILVSQPLNISIIALTINSDDIDMEFPEQDFGINDSGSNSKVDLETISSLIGMDDFNIKISKNVKFTTQIEGNRVTLTLKAAKEFTKSLTNSENCEEKYKENVNKHGKNTYYFKYDVPFFEKSKTSEDLELKMYHIVIRFGLDTVDEGYSYYRINVYDKMGGKVIYTLYGRVNAETNLRSKFALKSSLVFANFWAEATTGYYNYVKDKKEGKDVSKYEFNIKDAYKKSMVKGNAWLEPYKNTWGERETKHSFEASLSGSVTFEWVEGEGIKFVEGKIVGSLQYKMQHSSQYMLGYIPVVLEVDLSVGGKLTFKFNFDKIKIIDPTELELELKLEISANAGVGCKLASVGVYGKFGLVFIFDFIPEPGIESFKIYGEFGLYVKVLWFRYDVKIFGGEYYIVDNRGEKQLAYAMNSKNLMYLAEKYRADDQNNIDEMSRLFIDNGTFYKLYFVNATGNGYDEFNNRKLVISKWDDINSVWTTPTIIDDNGLNDSNYELFVDGNKYYVAYTQQMRKLDQETFNDTYSSASNLEMKIADLTQYVSGGDIKVSTVYKNSYYKYLETMQVVDGKLTIAWAQNTDNNIFGVSPKNYVDENGVSYAYQTTANSIYVSQLENGTWTTICLKDGLSTITDIAITEDGIISYIVDTNADLVSTNDRQLRYIDLESVEEKILKENGIISLDQFDGEIIYYYETENEDIVESGLKYIDLNDSTNKGIDFPEGIKVNNTYEIIKNGDEIFGIIYSENQIWEEDGKEMNGSALFGIFYNGKWGQPIVLKSAENNVYITSFASVVNQNTLFTTLTCSDSDGKILGHYNEKISINSNIVINNVEYDYENKKIKLSYYNYGILSGQLYYTIDSGSKEAIAEVLSGEAGQYLISFEEGKNQYDLEIFVDENIDSIYSEELSFDYADVSLTTKKIVVGEDDVLLICVTNNGNKSTSLDLNISLSYGNDTKLKDTKITYHVDEIDAGAQAYYNLVLDQSVLLASNVVISLDETEFEYGYLLNNNSLTLKVDENSENISTISSYSASYNGKDSIEISYIPKDSYALKEIRLNDIVIFTTAAVANVEDNAVICSSSSITFTKKYLDSLESGIHRFEIVFEGEYGKQQKSYFEISIVQKYTIVFNTGNGEITKTVLEGAVPVYDGYTPYKQETISSTYEFIGWDKNDDGKADAISKAYEDTNYVALFKENLRTYNVVWHVDEATSTTEIYSYGSKPEYKGNIDKFMLDNIIYQLEGWSVENDGTVDVELPEITKDLVLYAVYSETEHKHKMEYHGKVEPTYVKDGNIEYYTCLEDICKHMYYKDSEGTETIDSIIIPKLVGTHNYVLKTIVVEASCTQVGKYIYQCVGHCNEEIIEDIPMTDHIYKDVVLNRNFAEEANCVHGTLYYWTCSCGALSENTFEVGEIGTHKYQDVVKQDDLKHIYTCKYCDDSYEEEHNWDDGTEVSENGNVIMLYSCQTCHHSKVEVKEQSHQHTPDSFEYYDKDTHKVNCECGNISYEQHNFTETEEIVDEIVLTKYTCVSCNYVKYRNNNAPIILTETLINYNRDGYVVIKTTGNLEDFVEVRVNDEVLDTNNYLIDEEKLTISLKEVYLNNLENGEYLFKIVTTSGNMEVKIVVKNKDLIGIPIMIIIPAVSSIALIGIVIFVVKKIKRRRLLDD